MNWKDSLGSQIRTLIHANDTLDENEVNDVVRLLATCKGLRYFTGVGKNGHIASKLASTFSSLGLRSIFIDPVHALHGDMNLFENEDILIAISKSGSTEELIAFVQALRKNQFDNIIGVHSKPGSILDLLSKTSLYIPILSEGDHLELAPVGSSVVYMSVLQSLAVQISSDMGFSKTDFVKTHPGGALGRTDVLDRKIRHVIIQAGGKGTRLQKHTANKPKCLVSLDGKPLLYHVFDRFPEAVFYIIGDYRYDMLERYLQTFPPKQEIKLIRANGTGTCAGIEQARQLFPDRTTPFVLLWSDLYPLSEIVIPNGKANYVGLTNSFRCRWSWNRGVMEEKESNLTGVSGFFHFGSPEKLPPVPPSGEFVKFLHNESFPFDPLFLPPEWKEVGTVDALEKHNAGKVVSRFFNKVTISRTTVVKEPLVEEFRNLIEKESNWYREVNRLGFKNTPRLLGTSPFTLEKINGFHPFTLDLEVKEREKLLCNIVDRLHGLHRLQILDNNERDMELEYLEKTFHRFHKVKRMFADNFPEEYIINARPIPNYLHPKHLDILEEAYRILPRKPFAIIHGDPTFSNIIVDRHYEPWFIDPRGYFGSQILYGDPCYDFYKLFYSLKGNYDDFNRKNFTFAMNGKHVDLQIPAAYPWKPLESLFLQLTGLDKYASHFAVGLIWVSLAGYAVDDVDSIYGAFFKGLEFIHDGIPH